MEIEEQTVFFQDSKHMDCVEDNSVTLVVTSPPYWNVRDYGSEQIGFGQSYEQYIQSLNDIWKECVRVLQPNGKIAINVQPLPISSEHSGFNFRVIYDIMQDIEAFFRKNDCYLSGMVFWNKAVFVNNVSWGSYPKPTNIATNTSFEQIYTFVKRGETRKIDATLMKKNLLTKKEWRHWAVRCIWDDISPVIKINAKGENKFGHSAPFPEDIPYRLIKMHTVEGETILDPFLGSGTTLKVARILKRKGIGFEINQDFKEKIKNRIMEAWKPPAIEDGYMTLGYNSFMRVLDQATDVTIQQKTKEKAEIMMEILNYLEKTCSITPNIRRNLHESKPAKSQKKIATIFDFLQGNRTESFAIK